MTDYNGQTINASLLSRIKTVQGDWSFLHRPAYVAQGDMSSSLTAVSPEGHKDFWNYSAHFDSAATYKRISRQNVVLYTTANWAKQVVDGTAKITTIATYPGDFDDILLTHPNPAISVTNMTYDYGTGEVASMTDGNGRTSQFTYNSMGLVTSARDAKGYLTRFFYDTSNNIDLTSVVDNRNRVAMSAVYDAYHQPQTITQDPNTLNNTTSFDYTTWGAPSAITNAKSEVTTFNYDATSKRLANVTRSASTLSSTQLAAFTYDEKGRVRNQTDAFGLTRTTDYNDLDQPVKVNYSDGSRETTDYACCGVPGVTTDRAGRKSFYDYDEMKRLRRVQDAEGQTLQFDYDALGNMVQMTDSQGAVTRWQYDVLSRVVQKTLADGSGQSYT